MRRHEPRLGLALLLCVLAAGRPTWGQGATEMPIDYAAMLRALQPTLTFEVTEANLNAYLQTRPAEVQIPEGFEEPRIALTDGVFEISARKDLLFMCTRVRVGLVPEVVRGRLHLKVGRIHAGPVPLPPSFHMGVADTIEGFINAILARNEMQLVAVTVQRDLVRVTAKVTPPAPPPAGLETAP
jgi:uncharacterized protein YpmS